MRWPFEAWGADAVMAGHDHLYERFEAGNVPYFTVGLGGSSIYDFVTALPETRMQYNADYGALRVTADRTGMTFEFVNVQRNGGRHVRLRDERIRGSSQQESQELAKDRLSELAS